VRLALLIQGIGDEVGPGQRAGLRVALGDDVIVLDVGDGKPAVGSDSNAGMRFLLRADGDFQGPGDGAVGVVLDGLDVGVAGGKLVGVSDDEVAVAGHADVRVELAFGRGRDGDVAAVARAIGVEAGGVDV